MIKIENVDIFGWEAAIRGARRPMNSLEKSDSRFFDYQFTVNSTQFYNSYHDISKKTIAIPTAEDPVDDETIIGPADHKLLMNLAKGGSEEAKWRRMVHVQMDILAPLYWWKEFETYKVGTVSNSSSTMHKIHSKEFSLEDFSCEHLIFDEDVPDEEFEDLNGEQWEALNDKYCGLDNSDFVDYNQFPGDAFKYSIDFLNRARELYLKTKDKKYWWQMIQLLPSSYNQRRTIDLNYEVLAKQYRERKEHKLDEWRQYCEWIKTLPYSELITLEEAK